MYINSVLLCVLFIFYANPKKQYNTAMARQCCRLLVQVVVNIQLIGLPSLRIQSLRCHDFKIFHVTIHQNSGFIGFGPFLLVGFILWVINVGFFHVFRGPNAVLYTLRSTIISPLYVLSDPARTVLLQVGVFELQWKSYTTYQACTKEI